MEAPAGGSDRARRDPEALGAEVRALVERRCGHGVRDDTRLLDLGLDSVGTMELIADLEDHFGVVLPLESSRDVRTVGDAARRLAAAIAEPGSGSP